MLNRISILSSHGSEFVLALCLFSEAKHQRFENRSSFIRISCDFNAGCCKDYAMPQHGHTANMINELTIQYANIKHAVCHDQHQHAAVNMLEPVTALIQLRQSA